VASIGDLWNLVKKVDRLLELEEKQSKATVGLQEQVNELTARITRLEAREEIVVAEAKGAAGVAAMGAATAALADLSRRVGAMEERTRIPPPPRAKRLKPPD
jgi:hypothetical protein